MKIHIRTQDAVQMLRDSRSSSHYACDMAYTDQIFVTTVADNMRQYTKREVTQAKTAYELIARMDTHRGRRLLICSMLVCHTVMSQSKTSAMLTLSSDHTYYRSEARHTSVHRHKPSQCLLLVSHECSASFAVDFLFIKTDATRNLREEFVDCDQATVSDTDNIMRSRTQGLIALLSTGNLNGSVKMWCLATNATVIRDQIKISPMPDLVVSHITSLAESQVHARHRLRCKFLRG